MNISVSAMGAVEGLAGWEGKGREEGDEALSRRVTSGGPFVRTSKLLKLAGSWW